MDTATQPPQRLVALSRVRTMVPVLIVWVAAGTALSQATGRVKDWFVMSDELFYERLAISIARGGLPLPRVHGAVVPSIDQLLPLLLAPFYAGSTLVPAALHAAHVFDAFVMTSAAVPAFLLARRVVRDERLALGVAALSVVVPWIVYANVLLTEVVAYPAFLWALLAMQRTLVDPRPRNDLLALGGVALATLARTQLLALGIVLPLAVAVVAMAARRRPGHRVLVAVYGAAAVAAVALAATGNLSRVLGTYRAAGEGDLLPPHLVRSFAEHMAVVAVAVGVLPFLLAAGWALARVARPRDPERTAFAALALVALVVVVVEVTSFDLRYTGHAVSDRYLFYVVPLVLVALAAALVDPPWPRWSLVVPTAVVAFGFAGLELPTYAKLNFDRPLAVVYEHVVRLAGSEHTARFMLLVGSVVGAALLVEATVLLQRRLVAAVLAAVVLVALPAETGAALTRFFSVDGTSGRPVTLDQGVVFDWIDRAVGPTSDVAMVPYPVVPGDYWAGTAFWWDAEFWNRSVQRDVVYRDTFYVTSSSFPKLNLRVDPRTGRTNTVGSTYAAQATGDARFRISGPVAASERGVDLIRAERPWRVDWLTLGLRDDGWTKPGVPTTIRLFPSAGQRGGVVRYLDVRVRSASDGPRPFRLVLPAGVFEGTATGDTSDARVDVCVPARGFVDLRLEVSGSSPIYGDPRNSLAFATPREAGLLVTQIALADERGGACQG